MLYVSRVVPGPDAPTIARFSRVSGQASKSSPGVSRRHKSFLAPSPRSAFLSPALPLALLWADWYSFDGNSKAHLTYLRP